MLEQLIMIGTCFYGDGSQCGGMLLQDVMVSIAVVTAGCVGLLVTYRKFLKKETSPSFKS